MTVEPDTQTVVLPAVREAATPSPVAGSLARRSARATGRGGLVLLVWGVAGGSHIVASWALWVWQPEWAAHVKATREQARATRREVKAAAKAKASAQELQTLKRAAVRCADVFAAQSADLRKSRLRRLTATLVILLAALAGVVPLGAVQAGVSLLLAYSTAAAVLAVALVVVGALVTERLPVEPDEPAAAAFAADGYAENPHVTDLQVHPVEAEDPFPLADARNAYEAQESIRRALTAVGVDLRTVEQDVRRYAWGWQVPVLLRSGEPGDIAANLKKLEILLGLGVGQLHAQPDPEYAPRVVLRGVLRDPFADMPPIPIAAANSLSIVNTLVIAVRMDGQLLGLDLCGAHTIVIARTRAGKTVWLRRLVERLLACADVVVVDVDVSGAGGQDCYGDAIARRARTEAEAFELLQLLVAIAKVRPMLRGELGMDDESWEQSARHPAIVAVIDEFPQLSKRCKALAIELQQIGLKARVELVILSQKGTKNALGAAMADAFGNRILLACEHDDVVQVLGPRMLADGWRPDRLRPAIGKKPFDAGIFYALGGENDLPIQAKVERIVPAQARQIGRDRAGSRPQIDAESLAAARALLAEGGSLISEAAAGTVLIGDMQQVLGEADRMEAADMVAGLRRLDPDEYGELTQAELTARLRPLGLAERKKWERDGSWVRGYTRDALEAA